jgi:hypothetical protein
MLPVTITKNVADDCCCCCNDDVDNAVEAVDERWLFICRWALDDKTADPSLLFLSTLAILLILDDLNDEASGGLVMSFVDDSVLSEARNDGRTSELVESCWAVASSFNSVEDETRRRPLGLRGNFDEGSNAHFSSFGSDIRDLNLPIRIQKI